MAALLNRIPIYVDRRRIMTPPTFAGGETQDLLDRIPLSALEAPPVMPQPMERVSNSPSRISIAPVRYQQERVNSDSYPAPVRFPDTAPQPMPRFGGDRIDLSSSGPPVFSSQPSQPPIQLRASPRLPGVVERINQPSVSSQPDYPPLRLVGPQNEVGNFGLPVDVGNAPVQPQPRVTGFGTPSDVGTMPPAPSRVGVPRDPLERRRYLESRGVPGHIQDMIFAGEPQPRMRDHSTDAPRSIGGKILHTLEHVGKGALQGAERGGLFGAAGGALRGGLSPESVDRTEYERQILPRWAAQDELAQKRADAMLGRVEQYGRISGVNPVTGEPTPLERINQMGERYDDLNKQAQSRIDTANNRATEAERHNKVAEDAAATTKAQSQKMGRARFILDGYKAGGLLGPAERQALKDAGYQNADSMPQRYDPAIVRFATNEQGEITMFVARPQSGSVQTKGTGVKGQARGGGVVTNARAENVATEVFRQIGIISNGRIANPDVARETEAIKKRVSGNDLLRQKIEKSGESVDDYAKREAIEKLGGKGEILPNQHAPLKAFADWMELNGVVNPAAFVGSVKKYRDAIGQVRASGKSAQEQEQIINELKQEFTKRTNGVDLGWFQ